MDTSSPKNALQHAVRVWNEVPETTGSDNTCQNCGQSSERVTFIPEFEYMGCDDCVVEALAVLADEKSSQVRPWEACSTRLALANECSTVSEFRRALRAHAAECAVCGFEGDAVLRERLPSDSAEVRRKDVA